MSQLQDFRREIDDFMEHHPQSPLTSDQRAAFSGLNHYDENDSLAFTINVQRFSDSEPLMEMETSTGDRRLYRRWGRFAFTVDGEEAALTIYSDPHGHDFFMPFRDAASGMETYGAGRYMDNHRPALQQLTENQVKVDFNYAYNPYCAYNLNYSCPLPPRENWLEVPILAGEKNFE